MNRGVELRQLEHFVTVADEGNFTRAAARCHISQSALSTSIKSLERELGAPLFLRTTRRVELTESGGAVLTEARRTLAAAAATRAAVPAVHALARGSLRVGGIPTQGLLDQAEALALFSSRHPGLEISYARGTSMSLIPQVDRGELDLAFVSLPPRLPDGVVATTLATQPLMFVCRPDHALAGRKRVSLAALADEVFVGGPPGSVGYEELDLVFAAAGAERRVPFEVNDILAILDFVAHGLGVTLLQEYLASSRPDLCAIPLADNTMTWSLAAVTPAGDRTTAAARALLDLLV